MKSVSGKKNPGSEKDGYLLWGLIAAELFMSFSFLGYVHIDPISLTFVYIPVLIAGCILRPGEATLVGAVFGLASMWKASAFYVGVGDAIFSPAMSGKPVQSILLSVGSRALFGFISGLLYRLAKKSKHPLGAIVAVSTIGRTLHSFCVYGFMEVLFPESGYTIANVLDEMKAWNYILSVLATDLVIALCYIWRNADRTKVFLDRIHTIDKLNTDVRRNRPAMAALMGVTALAAFSVALYFINRIKRVMSQYGIDLSERVSYDLMHLQMQFLLGILSLAALVIMGIILYQKNYNYLYYKARMDGLTGLHGRRQFFQIGERLLAHMDQTNEERYGCFIILDVDEFKKINDKYGHPEGDRVLKEVANHLRQVFDQECLLGRLGGDEFVAMIYHPIEKKEIEMLLYRLRERIARIRLRETGVTCSVGVIPVEKYYTIDELYRSADRLLYEAKKKGKNQFAFGYRFRDQDFERSK